MDAVAEVRERPQPNEDKWNYEYFREYLKAIARGKKFLLTSGQYPKEFSVNDEWHRAINEMRRLTLVDSLERYALIGYKEDKRGIYLQIIPATGEPHRIPREVVEEQKKIAKDKYKLSGFVGDIHTHPYISSSTIESPSNYYSATDLKNLLSNSESPLKVLITPNHNLFAFWTKETSPTSIKDSEAFSGYWEESQGFQHLGPQSARAKFKESNYWDVNTAIAQGHGLVLYRANPNSPLQKAYPVST